jgi:hypothetical protein
MNDLTLKDLKPITKADELLAKFTDPESPAYIDYLEQMKADAEELYGQDR